MSDYQMLKSLCQEKIIFIYISVFFLPRVASKGQSWKCESLRLELANIIKSIPVLVQWKSLIQVVSTRIFLST